MYKVKVIAQGRLKEAWLASAIAEYEKRLQGRAQFQWVLTEDDEELAAQCKKESQFIALDIQGELLDSMAFSEKLMRYGAKITFAIGGPVGLSQEILKKAHWRWSLSPLTFTNQMVRLLFVEQIYRALEISRGSPYHK